MRSSVQLLAIVAEAIARHQSWRPSEPGRLRPAPEGRISRAVIAPPLRSSLWLATRFGGIHPLRSFRIQRTTEMKRNIKATFNIAHHHAKTFGAAQRRKPLTPPSRHVCIERTRLFPLKGAK